MNELRLSTDTRIRTSQLLRAVVESQENPPPVPNVTNTDQQNLKLAETLALKAGVIQPHQPPMATVTFTVRTSGGDYSTWASWAADLDNGALYSAADDAVGEGHDDSVFSISSQIDLDGGGTIGLNSVTMTSATKHTGIAESGVVIRATSSMAQMLNVALPNTSITYACEWLEFDGNGQNIQQMIQRTSASFGNTPRFRHLMIHGPAATSGGSHGINATNGSRDIQAVRCLIWDIGISGTGSPAYGIRSDCDRAESQIVNCTIFNIHHDDVAGGGDAYGVYFADIATGTMKNTLVIDVTAPDIAECFDIASYSNADVSHNGSSDATASGTGSLTSQVAVDLFVSTADGAVDLHLRASASAIGAGTDLVSSPSGVELDIDQYDVDTAAVTWDMGADQRQEVITTIGTSSRDYSTPDSWNSDLDNGATYTAGDRAIGEAYADSTFTALCSIDNGDTIGLRSRHLTVAAGQRHNGTAGTGVVLAPTGTLSANPFSITPHEDIETRLSWWELDFGSVTTYSQSSTSAGVIMGSDLLGPNLYYTRVDHMIIHDCDRADGARPAAIRCAVMRRFIIDHNIIYAIRLTHVNRPAYGIFADRGSNAGLQCKVYGNTVHDVTVSGTGDAIGIYLENDSGSADDLIAKNNLSTDNGTADFDDSDSTTTPTQDYNGSSDATAVGSNSLTSLSSSSLYTNATAGSENLLLKSGAGVIDEGEALTDAIDNLDIDIAGQTRPATWDIGASEFAGSPAPASSTSRGFNKTHLPQLAGA